MSRWLAVIVASACSSSPPAREPIAAAGEGMAIAIYSSRERSYGVVDDRRTIEVVNGTILLDRIDPAAALQSLVIEPLQHGSIEVVSCVRERIDDSVAALAQLAEARGERPRRVIVVEDHDRASDRLRFEETGAIEPAILPNPSVLSPLVRCRVKARAGKHLVRVLHVTSTLAFTTQHDLSMTDPERVHVTTRFAIATPTWRTRATVTLYAGVPSSTSITAPRPLATESVVLDGSTAIIATPPRTLPARMRSVYDGIKLEDSEDVKPSDIVWGRESHHHVWMWLEIADATLSNGPVRAHVALPAQPERDLEIAADQLDHTAEHARIPLWIDDDLLGTRRRTIDRADGVVITDRVQLVVSNLGTVPREVWVEERLRPAKRRTLVQAWPTRPQLGKGVARTKLVLAPGKTERLGFTIDYEL